MNSYLSIIQVISVLLSLLISYTSFSQTQYELNNFNGLKSEDVLSESFYLPLETKINKTTLWLKNGTLEQKESGLDEKFWKKEYPEINRIMSSGALVSGDPLTLYLNQIADTLLKNDSRLREGVEIYTFKSPSVNAFCAANGFIAVNVGLFAHAKSEAELAFILAHEISHFVEQHSYKNFTQRKDLKKSDGWFKKVHPIKKFDQLAERSREHELEADELGMKLFLKSSYDPEAVNDAFTTLYESFVSYPRTIVDSSFLRTQNLNIPNVYWRKKIKPIDKEEDYFDETHNHPNIATRRKALSNQIEGANKKGKKRFLIGEKRFYQLRNLARFESIREKVLFGYYGSVLYDIYSLESEFPNNKFLEYSKVRALFGLSSFKAFDKVSVVAARTSGVQGPSQQAFHILKQMNSKQLTSIALHHALILKSEYPDDSELQNYVDLLIRYMVVNCKIKLDEFEPSNALSKFNKSLEDFDNERQYLRAKLSHYRGFYKGLFQKEYNSSWLQEQFEKQESIKDSLAKDEILSVKERRKRDEALEEELDLNGSGLNIDKLKVFYNIEGINYVRAKDSHSDAMETSFLRMLNKTFNKENIALEILKVNLMEAADVERYNLFTTLKEWEHIADIYSVNDIEMKSIGVISGSKPTVNGYAANISGWSTYDEYHYQLRIIDINTGKILYDRQALINENFLTKSIRKELEIDLNRIKN